MPDNNTTPDEKYFQQIDMRAIPTKDTHLVTLKTLQDYVSGRRKENVTVVSTINEAVALSTDANGRELLTYTTNTESTYVIDGITLSVGDRVLLTGMNNAHLNGIYEVTVISDASVTYTTLRRALDWDTIDDIVSNVLVPVGFGDVHKDSIWQLTTDFLPTATFNSLSFNFVKAIGGGVTALPTNIVLFEAKELEVSAAKNNLDVLKHEITHGLELLLIVQIRDSAGDLIGAKTTLSTGKLTIETQIPLPEDTYQVLLAGTSV